MASSTARVLRRRDARVGWDASRRFVDESIHLGSNVPNRNPRERNPKGTFERKRKKELGDVDDPKGKGFFSAGFVSALETSGAHAHSTANTRSLRSVSAIAHVDNLAPSIVWSSNSKQSWIVAVNLWIPLDVGLLAYRHASCHSRALRQCKKRDRNK